MCGCYQPQNKYLRMNKNQKLVKKFLAGNLDGTRTFKQMTSENEEEIKRAKETRDTSKAYLKGFLQGHGMVSTHPRPEEVFRTTQLRLQKSLASRKQDYTQACSIVIESGVLRCQVPVEREIPGSHASIKVAGRNFFLTKKSFSIPEEFMGKDPIECEAFADWGIQTMIMQGNFFVWVVLRDELKR